MKPYVIFLVAVLGLTACGAASYGELVAYWSFNDGLGTTLTDNTGRGNNGELRGDISQPTWDDGHTGQSGDRSLKFLPTVPIPGSMSDNPYVFLDNPDDLKISGDQTISVWLRPTNFGWGRQNPYSKDFNRSGTITLETDGDVNYYYGDGTWKGFRSTHELAENEWNHVAIVRSLASLPGSNGRLTWYINGEANSTSTNRPCIPGDSTAYFGRGYVGSYHGYIDDAAIWNEALSPMDVLFLQKGIATPLAFPTEIEVVEYTYSVTPNAHSDFYKDEGKDPNEDGIVDNPTGDLTDGPFFTDGGSVAPDDGTVGWLGTTAVDLIFDFGSVQPVNWIDIGYSVYTGSGNYAPDDVQIAYSIDGVNYSPFTTYTGFDGLELRNDLLINVPDFRASHVMLRFDGANSPGPKFILDQVSFLQIPEPGSAVLAVVGLIGLLLCSRKRRSARA